MDLPISCTPQTEADLLTGADLGRRLSLAPHWTQRGDAIERDFSFGNFHQTMAFVNAVAWIAHQEDHHPDLEVGYKHCLVRYRTHSAGGLTDNDFICATRIDALLNAP